MKKIVLIIVSLFFIAGTTSSQFKKKNKSKSKVDEQKETLIEYQDRMIETIQYYVDKEYYTEASFLLSDLRKIEIDESKKSAVNELNNKVKKLFAPDKENSLFNKDILVVAKNFTGKYGYIDNMGKFVIDAKYDKAEQFSDGMALVTVGEEKFFIDRTGQMALKVEPRIDMFYDPNGMVSIYIDEFKDVKYTGQFEINLDRIRVEIKGGFHNGLALCEIKTYTFSTPMEGRNRTVHGRKGYIFINKKGEEIITLTQNHGHWDDPKYEYVGDFSEGYAVVQTSNKSNYLSGYIDVSGKLIVEPTFKKAFPFQNGMALVLYPNTKKWGYIDTNGNTVIKPFVDGQAFHFLEEVALVTTKAGFVGYINKTGEEVYKPNPGLKIDPKGGQCRQITYRQINGLRPVHLWEKRDMKEDKEAIIFFNKKGRKVFELKQQQDYHNGSNDDFELFEFRNGRAFIKTMHEGWALINVKGDYVINPQKEWVPISHFYNGLAKIKNFKTGNEGYMNRDGKIVLME